jgi:hypothetical protein
LYPTEYKNLPQNKIAIISGDDGLLDLHSIDSHKTFVILRPGVEIHVLPGLHVLTVTVRAFRSPDGRLIYTKGFQKLKFMAVEGHHYKVQYQGIGDWTSKDGKWYARIIDADSKEILCPKKK